MTSELFDVERLVYQGVISPVKNVIEFGLMFIVPSRDIIEQIVSPAPAGASECK
jgi:hypothetical protein